MSGNKIVAGYIEDVVLMPGNLEVRAKLDSGARTSSLNAPKYKIFLRNGKRWVSFRVTNRAGRSVRFERPIVRTARIKRIRGVSHERPVVMLSICLGPVFRQTEVNLVNRQGFNYQMLVGRRFMRDRVIVDPGRVRRTRPTCTETPPADPNGAGRGAPARGRRGR